MMKLEKIALLRLLTICLIITICSCTSGGGSDGENPSSNPDSGNTEQGQVVLNCGVVKNDSLVNPVSESDGEVVQIVRAADHNALVVQPLTGGEILVKLHGVDNQPSAFRDASINLLNSLSGQNALLVRAGENCPAVLFGGGLGTLGQLITASGVSVSENLIRTGFANSTSADACSSSLVSSCYTALYESNPFTAGELDSLLWKPDSDSTGNLAIHTGPYGTIVTVNGEVGENQGPGNGYGSLARFSKPGCAYSNPQIVVRSSDGLVYTLNGQTRMTVGNPCGRHCLINGQIVACTK